MMLEKQNSKLALDQAIAAMREDEMSPESAEAATKRAWQAISQGAPARPGAVLGDCSPAGLRGCADVVNLLPDYRARRLPAGRMMLVEDHLHECVSCRLRAEGAERTSTSILPWERRQTGRREWPMFRYAVAAAILLTVSATLALRTFYFSAPAGSRATLQSVQGEFYRVTSGGERRVGPGEEFYEGDLARAGRSSRAMVRLRDGSLVEMNEGAELSVSATRRDAVIHFDRGNIIVQAAKRRTGHLYVLTPDCKVSVTGTVFAVDAGIKGSRVAVIEGEVRVAQQSGLNILHPGEQVATSASVGELPLREQIAWSGNLDQHLALLAELSKLQDKFASIALPHLRYESRLLGAVPEDSVVFASIANYGEALTEANRLFQQQLAESNVLRDWWQQGPGRSGDFAKVIEKLQGLSQYLGDEIVLSATSYRDRRQSGFLVMAEVKKQGLREFLQSEMQRTNQDGAGIQVVSEDELASASFKDGRGLLVLTGPDFVAASMYPETLRSFAARWGRAKSGAGFQQTAFGERIASVYSHGVSLLFAADLRQMVTADAGHEGKNAAAALNASGFKDGRYLIVERKEISGQTLNTAELSFTGGRRGIAGWLAAPAPIGALNFITPNAAVVSAFVTKTPAQMFDDLVAITQAGGIHYDWLPKIESKLNINLRDDLISSFGGDAAFALDGPLLPAPSYKLVVEVNDSDRLRYGIQRLVEAANREEEQEGKPGIRLESELVNGRTFYEIYYPGAALPVQVHYTFADGYLIVAASRALLLDAIHVRESGDNLAHSGQLRSLLPSDGHVDVSGLLYQNLAPVLGPVAGQLSPSQLQSLQLFTSSSKPSLMCVYGEDDRIILASNDKQSSLNLAMFSLLLRMEGERQGTSRRPAP